METLEGDARDTPTSRDIILLLIFTTLTGRFAASIAIVAISDLANIARP